MARKSKQEKINEKRIETAFYAVSFGIQIPIMDLPKIMNLGRKIISEGGDDDKLKEELKKFVEEIAHK